MFRRILIPTDGSDCSMQAVEQGLQLAKKMAAEVTFLFAVEVPITPAVDGALYLSDFYEDLKAAAQTALETVADQAAQVGVPSRTVLAERQRPVNAILETAKVNDLLVIATHGRRGFDRFVFGSVAENVIRRVTIPCLVVHCRPPAEVEGEEGNTEVDGTGGEPGRGGIREHRRAGAMH